MVSLYLYLNVAQAFKMTSFSPFKFWFKWFCKKAFTDISLYGSSDIQKCLLIDYIQLYIYIYIYMKLLFIFLFVCFLALIISFPLFNLLEFKLQVSRTLIWFLQFSLVIRSQQVVKQWILTAQWELQGELTGSHVSCHQMYAHIQVFFQIISVNLHILWRQIKDLRLRPWWWTLVDTWRMNE